LAALTGWRWRSAHLFIARAPAERPVNMGMVVPCGNRLQFVLGEHVACGPLSVATGTLAP
jgi:hypothetical protein